MFVRNGNICLKIERFSNVDAVFGVFNGSNELDYPDGSDKPEEPISSEVKVIEETREYAGNGDDLTIKIKAINIYTPYPEEIALPID